MHVYKIKSKLFQEMSGKDQINPEAMEEIYRISYANESNKNYLGMTKGKITKSVE